MITLSTASAVLRLYFLFTRFYSGVDYIVYCFGGIETAITKFILASLYLITLSTASAVLRHTITFNTIIFIMITLSTASAVLRLLFLTLLYAKRDYIVYCFGGIETHVLLHSHL